jgi:diguanylate cyclase (GGDEF)-like protein
MNALPRPEAAGEEPLADVSVLSAERQLASYRQLVETAHLLLMGGSLAEVLNRVADALQRLIPFDALTIYVADNERRLLFPVLARDAWADSVLSQGATPFGTGIVGWVADHLEPVNIAHDVNDPRLRQIPGTPDEPEAIVVMPLIARETFRGVFALYREGGRNFSADEFALAQLFADQASLAIDSAAAHDALSASARTDSVTGLYNHRFFHEQLRAELNRAHRYRHEVSLVVLDLDDFKGVNDRYGHLEGDAVLHRVGALLAAEVRGNDAACRIGGEEFALILPHTDVEGATELAERVRATVRGTSFGKAGRLSISSGVATMPTHAQDVTSLIDRADAALYASKNAGKNRVTVYADGVATEREVPPTGDGRLSSLAVLENLSHRVAGLGNPVEIAGLIALELRGAIDYHHCRVLLVDESGEWLVPVAEGGELFTEGDQRPDLRTRVGEGITGRAVAEGKALVVDDASAHPAAMHVAGTAHIEESLLAVPMRYDQRAIGAIVLSKLGIGQFTAADRRLVEILAAHAAVAFENAALNAARRRAARRADAVLKLATDAAARGGMRRRLSLLRRAVGAAWVALLRQGPDGVLRTVDASADRAGVTRALQGLTLGPGQLDGPRLGRLGGSELTRLPAAAGGQHVLRQVLDDNTLLLCAASSESAVRELRTTLRDLGDRLPGLLGADGAPVAAPAPAVERSAPSRRRVGRIAAHLPSGMPRRKLLGMLTEHAVRMTGADGAYIADLDASTNTLRYLLSAGTADTADIEKLRFAAPATISGEAIREGHTVVADDYRRHPLAQPAWVEIGVRSVAAVPISAGGKTIAAICCYSLNRPVRFRSSQIAIMEVIAQQAGALIAQDTLYQELESSYRATVEALTNALEVKDAYTSEHVRQIAEMALDLGRTFRLGGRRLRQLEYAAILHDIGKIGIPSAILTKPGPLDADERAVVEKHTIIGHNLLKDIPFLARVAEIVRAGHERWDGGGYPDRVSGEEIPLEARIIFVCDAWHAMRSDRPYRKALDVDTARERLRGAAGTQFDPKVVDLFLGSDHAI